MEVFPNTSYLETTAHLTAIGQQNASGKIYDSLPVRHRDTYEDGRRNHIFVMPLYFPDEKHWVQRPGNSMLWHDTVLDWPDRWTGNNQTPKSAVPASGIWGDLSSVL